ncbi:kinesin-like protein KIN-7D, mitochondrial [Capsicum chacoense]
MEETHKTLKFASRAKRVKIYLSRNKLEEGQVKIQSRLEEEEDAKDALLSQIQKLTKLIFVSLKNSIPGSRFSSSSDVNCPLYLS